jgi:nucleoid DNA-binding protein
MIRLAPRIPLSLQPQQRIPVHFKVPMATAKKTAAPASKKTTSATAAKTAAPAKKAPAPAKKAAAPAKKAPASKPAAKPAATPLKPIKTSFSKTSLTTFLAERSGVDAKAAKAIMAALEETILASIHKKGAAGFTLPGLLKITAQSVPAKKARKGKDPFTGVERMFAAKPASTKIKARALKKLKDAAL